MYKTHYYTVSQEDKKSLRVDQLEQAGSLWKKGYLIRSVARKGYGSIAIDPWPLRAKGLIVLVSPN